MKRILSIWAVLFIMTSAVGLTKHQNGCNGDLLKFELTINIGDDDGGNGNLPKGDSTTPSMSLADHTLFIYGRNCDDTTLRLIDGSDNVAFTQYIPTGTTQVVLPSTLSGTYELQIIRGQYLFYTEIEL